jgi:hypothetical protein
VRRLQEIQARGLLLVDDFQRILTEYRHHASLSGQPGLGDAFLRWAWDNQANPDHCEQVQITPCIDRGFDEFPSDPGLSGFDRSDRKFVAVAMASGRDPVIYNATDTDWWIYRIPLKRSGVRVQFLCPDLMKKKR